jgi:hypothetical protein
MNIEKYENSFNKYSFKECLIEKHENSSNLNPYYYEKTINNWCEQRCKELSNNNKLKEHFTLLRNYLIYIKFLFISIIELYQAIERYNNIRVRLNVINIKEHHVITNIEQLQTYNLVVRENLSLGFDNAGKKIKDYILLRLDDMYLILKEVFHIDFLKSPLKNIYQETYDIIEESTKQIEPNQDIKAEDYKEYFEITILFAQGIIKALNGEKCSYNDKVFNNPLELEKYLKENIIKKVDGKKQVNIRQYLRHTLIENGDKNLYSSFTMIDKTYKYCKRKGVKMTNEFQLKRTEFDN